MKSDRYYEPEDMHGLFAGQFESSDYEPFLKTGEMKIVYIGVAGLMGLGRLIYIPQDEQESN